MPSPPAPPRPDAERLALLVERTARLHRLTAHLSTALTIDEVAVIVVDEGTTALDAFSGALWRLDDPAAELVLVRAARYPRETLAHVQRIPLAAHIPVADAARRGEPVWLSSRADYEQRYAASEARTRDAAPPQYAVAALPIALEGHVLGVLAITFRDARGFDEDERTYLSFLALHCAQGFQRARLYESETCARRDAEAAKERAQFLARASALLGGSLDYEDTLRNVAQLAVPNIGDWCGVDLIVDGEIRQVAVAHTDPAKIELAREYRRAYPPDPAAPHGIPNVLRTGVAEVYPVITDEMLVASALDDEHLRQSRALGFRSALIVPIADRGVVVGAISFVIAELDRPYTADDVVMAEQLGERAGAAITNARLYRAAQQAVRARDDFMLIAGHELRTPIAAIALHHEALASTRDDTPLQAVRDRGVKLHAQTLRLGRLVEDLLDVSRLAAGRLELDREEVELGGLVRDIAERMRDELDRAHTVLTLDAGEVHGAWDRARIDQIVTNLLGNAVKYGKGAPIEIRVQRVDDAATVTVTDHGPGIPAADQVRIFERFERAVSTRKYGGLGLGLWIAAQLVEAHGGTIGVVSEPGAGATFTVTLPLDVR